MIQDAFWGILIPFLGTSLGAGCVFFLKNSLRDGIQRALTGFAAGVMVAASVWSLLIPAIERSEELGKWSFAPAAAGLWLGFLFLLALDHIIPHLHWGSAQPEGPSSRLRRTTMMVLAVTLHNIPEGMAVGLSFALAAQHSGGGLSAAMALAMALSQGKSQEELARLARSRRPAWRVRVPEEVLSFRDLLQGGVSQDLSLDCGDFILRRSDGVYAYQLAVVVDDGAMGVTQVVRGSDLLDSTPRQLWLQERLGLPHPEYGHVPLLLAPDGRRLAKRDRDQELGALQSCYSAQELVGQLALLAGLIPEYAPISPAELIPLFSWEKLPQADCAVHWADGICTFFTKTIQSPVQRDRPPV